VAQTKVADSHDEEFISLDRAEPARHPAYRGHCELGTQVSVVFVYAAGARVLALMKFEHPTWHKIIAASSTSTDQ
jgi:hypothetical protein